MTSIFNRIYFYDLETTALEIHKACILECFIRNWDGTRNKHWYIYPSNNKPITNSHIHQITEQKLLENNAVTIDQFITEMIDFLKVDNDLNNNSLLTQINDNPFVPLNKLYLIAHNNNRYDKLVLFEEFSRRHRGIPLHWNFRDSLVHFRRLYPNLGLGKYKLSELYNRFREDCEELQNISGQLHSASYDTVVMCELYKKKIFEYFSIISQFEYFFENTL
jgi:DNA polymerase III epsilon subunit-like protein